MATKAQTIYNKKTLTRPHKIILSTDKAEHRSSTLTNSSRLVDKKEKNNSSSSIDDRPLNFSARNSLRTSQSFANSLSVHTRHHTPYSMANHVDGSEVFDKSIKGLKLFSDSYICPGDILCCKDFSLLNSECFIKRDGADIVCILCYRREKYRSEKTISRHLASPSHNDNYNQLRFALTDSTPDASSVQITSIRELLSKWYRDNQLTDKELKIRLHVVGQFDELLKQVDNGCHSRLIGSLLSGTSLKYSDINLELLHPNSKIFHDDPRAKKSIHHKFIDADAEFGHQINFHTAYYDMVPNAIGTLLNLMKFLRQTNTHKQIFAVISNEKDLISKVPRLALVHVKSNTKLDVTCYSESAYKQAMLFNTYLSLDKRARVLGILVKYWAHLCRIDNPEQGTFPPDAFLIMVIYYLQRISPPVLPCLHEIICSSQRKENTESESCRLMVNLDLNAPELKLTSTKSYRSAHKSSSDKLDNNTDECAEVGEDDAECEDEEDDVYFEAESAEIKNLNWISKNNWPVHILFIDFMKCMIREFDCLFNVITIRTLEKVTLAKKDWNTQVKAIENPIKPRLNISRCIGTVRTLEYIKKCFRHGYYYLTCLPLDAKLRPKNELYSDPRDFIELYVNLKKLDAFVRRNDSLSINSCVRFLTSSNVFARDIEALRALLEKFHWDKKITEKDLHSLIMTVTKFYNKDFLVPRDWTATTFCWLCRKNGHTRNTCPKMNVDSLKIEPETYDIDLDIKATFDNDFIFLYSKDMITQKVAAQHEAVLSELSKIINTKTDLKCLLQPFGSTVNDLGSHDSDLDICMTLENNPTGKGVDCVEVLEKVLQALDTVEEVYSIEPILTARVPIIRFEYKGFDVDLSMYNQCAIYNSKLLKTYASFDKRVSQLFYLVKRFAKSCGIADASRGSLSSYAWSLLVIHYLQHTAPPILPVLQEINDGSEIPIIGVNGWNVWFDVYRRESFQSSNKLTLTQLFKGFFLYYGNFDFNFHVVSIRKSQLITRFQKNWHTGLMAIEDPFELTYNLGSRLDELMAIYIINSFTQAFRHIIKIQDTWLTKPGQPKFLLVQRIFNGRDITGSSPPYRGCRICHRIGHKVKECPEKNRGTNHDGGAVIRVIS